MVVVCPQCSFYFKLELSGRSQQTDCPQCGTFAGKPTDDGQLLVDFTCKLCNQSFAIDILATDMVFCCPHCSFEPTKSDESLLRRLAVVWRLRQHVLPAGDCAASNELINIDEMELSPILARIVPISLALAYSCVPVRFEDGLLTVAVGHRPKQGMASDLAFMTNCRVQCARTTPGALSQAIRRIYGNDSLL